jgi:4-amino-4-deoxy-L-arabinose transferase-like glycosyltransferase
MSSLPWPAFLIALAVIFAWRLYFCASFNLIPDECSYWAWSRRLDWSYFDNSGMVAYLIRLSTALFQESTPFTVRFSFFGASLLGTVFFFLTSRDLFARNAAALLAALLLNLMPLALLGGATAMHDNALILFWILTMWAGARFLRTEEGWWFYVMGVFAGLAIQSKYTGVLLLPSLLLFLLWSSRHRRWLIRKEPWLGAFIAMVFALPIVWWNIQHDWASLHHILFIGSGSPSVLKRIGDGLSYHLAQVLLVSPLFYFALLVGLVAGLRRNLFRPEPKVAFLLCMSFPLGLFGILAFAGHVEANWAFMGYPASMLLTVNMVARSQEERWGGIWRYLDRSFLEWAIIIAVIPAIVAVAHARVGLLPASIEKRLGKADRIIWETRGWDGLGEHVGRITEAGETIAADTYQLCALLEFNVPAQPRARYLAPWRRPTQFDVWEPSYDNLKGATIVFVSERPLKPSSDVRTTVYDNFEEVETLAPYNVMYHGKSIRQIHVYRGVNFDPFQPRRLGPRSLLYTEY